MENNQDEKQLLRRFREGDEAALDRLFETYYGYLFKIACSILSDPALAKDCVQEVFVRFWQKRGELEVKTTLKGYLQRSIINECLGQLRKRKLPAAPEEASLRLPDPAASAQQTLEMESLNALVQAAVDRLPEQCRLIFRMSRLQELSYREIAEQLEISPKTVENQIGKALRQLRAELGPWLKLLLPILAFL
ncbi:MAG: RNA polymerase sigma-70 factor [Saprospiraceae bacterium]|jgi:RNA polymerase sigma-70 factor (ECF subfamily)|nr:RNA polymerase sigma-70 factor [Lewinellaceae bacterium]